MKRAKMIIMICLVTGLSVTGSAAIWTGGAGTSNWSNAANWDTGVVPVHTTEVSMNNNAVVTYDVSGNFERSANTALMGNAALSISGKRFLSARYGACNVTIADGALLTHSGEYFCVGQSYLGVLNQSGGTVTAAISRGFHVNDATSSAGSAYNLTGGTLNVTLAPGTDDGFFYLLGKNTGTSTFYVNGGNATFAVSSTTSTRRLWIKGNSVLQIDSGSLTLNYFQYFSIGREGGNTTESKMIINGGTTNITTTSGGAVVVGGQNAQGRLTINGGTLTIDSPNGLWVGDGNGCYRGIAEQTGGDVIISNGGDVVLGRVASAVGSYYQMDGGTLTVDDIYLTSGANSSDFKFIFNAGVITLNGDRTAILGESWFQAAAGTVVVFDSVNNVTVISRIPYAHNPSPANGAANVPADSTLVWNIGLSTDPNNNPGQPNANITSHRLYMSNGSGTDPNLYFVAEIPASDPVVATASYGPLSLGLDKTYTWRVDEIGEPNTITGPVWSFSTPHATAVQTGISPVKSLVDSGTSLAITNTYTSVASPVTAVTWYQNGVALNPQADTNISVVFDNTQSTLTIASMSEAYEGFYYCVATNAGGNSDPSATAQAAVKKLVAWYAFENDVTDSAHDYDGTNIGEPNFVTGKVGQALDLDGIAEAVSIPLSIQDDFTIELWIKTASTGGTGAWYNGRGIIDGEVAGAVNDFGTSLVGSKFGFGVGNPDTTIASTTNINDNQWHYCVAVRDSETGRMEVYMDGQLEASVAGPAGIRDASAVLRIGSIQTAINYLAGQIDEVKLYNYTLTDLTIAVQYNAATGQSACVNSRKPNARYDFNGDCIVNIADFAEFASNWLDCGIYPDCS